MAENKNIEVGGRLHSIATGNVLAGANEIFDDDKNKKQSEINTETYSLVNDVNKRLSGLSPDQQSALSVAAKATNNEIKLGYYVCSTEDNIAAKVISDATGYVLSTGGSIKVKMTNANTVDNSTLNINSTGAKPLYYNGERASTNNSWEVGETIEVYYDGISYYANNVAGGNGSGDGALDVSVKYPTSGVEGGNTYTLNGALAVLNANLSASKKKGGMSIKFIQSSDNKYGQFRYLLDYENTTAGNAAFVNPNNWQGVDVNPTAYSHSLVESGGTRKAIDQQYLNADSDELALSNMTLFHGFINDTVISDLGQATYIAIKVGGGERFSIKSNKQVRRVAIVSEFEVNPDLPYSYVYATGESIRTAAEYNITLPSDARYILIGVTSYGGDDIIPDIVALDGYDFTKKLSTVIKNNIVNNSIFSVAGKQLLTTGAINNNSSYYITDYLLVKSGDSVIMGGFYGAVIALAAFYDKNKTYIANSAVTKETLGFGEEIVIVPENAVYMVCCTRDKEFLRSYVRFNQHSGIVNFINNNLPVIQKEVDSYGFAENTVGPIKIAQRLSSIGNPFKNLGYYYDINGKKITSENYACTDLLPIIDNIRIGVRSLGAVAAICFYNSDKTFHSYIEYSTIGTVGEFHDYVPTIPLDAKYFAVNISKVAITEGYIVMGNVEQYLADKSDFPELMHTIYDVDLVREHKIYTDEGVGTTNTSYDAVKLNVSEGDVLRITCNIGSSTNYHAVKFYTSNGGTLVEAKLLDGDFIDAKVVVPPNATFAICQGRSTANTDNVNHIQLKVNLYAKYKDAEEIVDERLFETSELEFSVDGKYITSNGSIVTNSSYHCTNFIQVEKNDKLNIIAYTGDSSLLVVAGYNSNSESGFVRALLSGGTYNNREIIIPSDISYVVISGKKLVEGNIVDAEATLVRNVYVTKEKIQDLDSSIEYNALMLEPCQGYYRKTLSLVCSANTLGYRISVPIPVKVGDIITAGTTISYPFDTVAHITFDANKDYLSTLNMSNGSITITQAMWDSGVRYIAISYRPDDTPSLTVTRNSNAEPFVLDKTLRMKISPYTNGFILWIPSKQIGGKYVGYYFMKDYKKWDSLEYKDGDGNTQTLTDIVNTDVWNCLEVYNENMEYMAQGNTNFIFSIDGESYVGDGHGNEASMFSQFLINGKVKEIVSESTFFYSVGKVLELDSFECKWKSNIYRHGSGAQYTNTAKPYINTDGTLAVNAEHYLNARFYYGNKIRIENTLNIKRNNITFYSLNGAMLECYFGDFSYLSVNNDNNDINQVADDGIVTALANSTNLAPGTGGTEYQGVSVKANEAKMWGKGFAIMQRMEPKYNDRLGKCGIYIHKYANRIKCYFHPVVTTRTASAIGVTKETFNDGDVISVVDYREIEV